MSEYNEEEYQDIYEHAANYVIGTLTLEQRQAFEALLADNEAARNALIYWQQRLEPLNKLSPPVEPSDFTFHRINRSVDALTELSQASKAQTPETKQHSGLWRFATAALLVLSIGLFFHQKPATTSVVVLTAPGQTEPGWMITSYDGEHIELKPLVSTSVPENKTLEFWTKADGWDKPVSLGLVDPNKNLKKQLDALQGITPNQLFELTIEQAGGSPTGLPTGPVQFIGRAVIGI